MLRAPGDRPLFTEHKPEAEAIEWWRKHRNDPLGKKVIDRMFAADAEAPLKLAELDSLLSQKIEADLLTPAVDLGDS